MKNALLFILLCFPACIMANQNPYTIKRLGVEDGLSSNYLVSIAQDKQGCMWFATEAGLNKFNGKQFTVYTKNSSGLTANELNYILADPVDNVIWIGTQRNGLCAINCDNDTFTTFKAGDGDNTIATNDITHLALSSDKKGIWISTFHIGINYYDIETQTFSHFYEHNVKGLGGQKNYVACDDGKGNLYIGHAYTGMSIVSLKDNTLKNFRHDPADPSSLPGDEVNIICIDRNQNVWVGTSQGLALFNPATGKFTSFKHDSNNANSLLSDRISDIRQMEDGTLWICTNMGGVSILDMQENVFTAPDEIQFRNIAATNDNHGLSGPNARCAFQDSYGNIWIGNYRGGVDFISYAPPGFNTLPYVLDKSGSQGQKQVWGLYADKNDVWLGGEEELAVFRGRDLVETISLQPYQTRPNSHVNVIFKDSRGRFWLGTYQNGIFMYEPGTKRIKQIVNNPKDEDLNVHCFYEDTQGVIWAGTETGIFTYSNNTLTYHEELNNKLPDIKIHGIIRDKEGKLWIGTFGKGVSVIDTNNDLIWNFVVENGFCSNAVNHMMQDSQDRIWVSTREGVCVFEDTNKPGTYRIFNERQRLENTQVRAAHEDPNGQIWVSTNGGISRLDEAQQVFHNYNHFDNVPMGDFMNGSACMTDDGTLYFGSQNGACYFNPEDIATFKQVSPVTITRFSTFRKMKESRNEELLLPVSAGEIKLPYNQNTFKVSFNIPDYTQSPQAEYAYMLEGLENIWYDTDGESQVTFRNVAPGKYVFKVRARIRNQDWDRNTATLTILVSPPIWLTWYAKLFYAIVIILALYGLLRFYKRKIDLESSLEVERKKVHNEQELNNERLRFYTNITHELRTPLTLILGPLEDLLSDSSLSPKHANRISIIHDSATRLLNLINRILEFRKTETENRKLTVAKGNLSRLVYETGLKYKELNPNNKIEFIIDIENENLELFYDAEMITIILDNLLSNATKYTDSGSITLKLSEVEENHIRYTQISVADTGYGINADALPHIFDRYYQAKSKYQASGSGIGLALVKGLADLHEGILQVKSKENVGTTFSLRLLTENTYPNAIHSHSPEIRISGSEGDAGTIQQSESSTETQPIMLIVEDNQDIRDYIRGSFCDVYEVITAVNGKEGWELAQTRIPNIIISDIMMPVMDGIELCKLVKDDMRTSHIPVILLTAKDSIQAKEEGYASGADSYITKPFSAKLLHSRINNLLESRKKIATLLTSNTQQKQKSAEESLNKLDSEFLQKVTRIIEDNLSMEKMDIAFIADKMCMSHSTLYRKVKGLTGMSANEFIRKIKMRNAVRFLETGEHTISEIAYMTGFSSVAYFRQCFKDEFGMAPSDYIRNGN